MLDPLQQAELKLSCFLQASGVFSWSPLGQVDTHLARYIKVGMAGQPVLEVIRLIQQIGELIQTDPEQTLRLFDASLFYCPGEQLGYRPAHGPMTPVLGHFRQLADNIITGANVQCRGSLQLVVQIFRGKEDHGANKGNALRAFLAGRLGL
ncbi:hypothetical protein D3C84_967320 [compost metagenome]